MKSDRHPILKHLSPNSINPTHASNEAWIIARNLFNYGRFSGVQLCSFDLFCFLLALFLSLSLFWLLWFEKENKSISSAECLRTKFISFVRLLYINCFLKETSIFYLLFQLKRKKFREEEALRRGSLRKVWRISKTSVYYDVPLCFIHWQQ